MSTESVPEALREAVSREIEPVTPLAPTWQRALVIAAAVTAVAAVVLVTSALRSDLDRMPMWLSWGCALGELLLGVFIAGLALREAIPGAAVPSGLIRVVLLVGVGQQVVVGLVTWRHSQARSVSDAWLSEGIGCIGSDAVVALPVLGLTLWMVCRALPLRAPTAGLLGGAGAAITGDAILHLLCPISSPWHVMVWHTGAIIGFVVLGWILGLVLQRFHWRRRLSGR
jgi:hypothetical protein